MKIGFGVRALLISSRNSNPLSSPPLLSLFSPFSAVRSLPSPPPFSAAEAMPETETHDVEWPAKRVRDTFISFFQDKNHVNWKSSPVVPFNDPTLLFANAGTFHDQWFNMRFFVPYSSPQVSVYHAVFWIWNLPAKWQGF